MKDKTNGSRHEQVRNAYNILVRNLKPKENFEAPGLDGRTVQKTKLTDAWAGFNWLYIRSNGQVLKI
jgi:hypothetical protein